MGRGRAKAKQTKVARKLKYFSPDTDLSALEQELHASTQHRFGALAAQDVLEDDDDLEDDAGDDEDELDDDGDDYESWASGHR